MELRKFPPGAYDEMIASITARRAQILIADPTSISLRVGENLYTIQFDGRRYVCTNGSGKEISAENCGAALRAVGVEPPARPPLRENRYRR